MYRRVLARAFASGSRETLRPVIGLQGAKKNGPRRAQAVPFRDKLCRVLFAFDQQAEREADDRRNKQGLARLFADIFLGVID